MEAQRVVKGFIPKFTINAVTKKSFTPPKTIVEPLLSPEPLEGNGLFIPHSYYGIPSSEKKRIEALLNQEYLSKRTKIVFK